ncbi:hypothetical protein HMPREF1624_00917 [Sporothrix schenckii ATCC 58251]|uniref:Spindle pole body component n=1 Tax=Sporothrix schenckii (strain ATCC 58251 / de Perez 2211183) TaxID=1391915 RepID=U7Q7A6_SPOS1|nr:hypothetical protein HMPREF1624_00917 [Sporothrix schenckii ATCC 58251]
MADTDNADLFAIPDFWKLSSWQQQPPPLAAEERQNGFFSLDVNGDGGITFFLGTDEPELPPCNDDDGGLFKIPHLLNQLLPSVPEQTLDKQDTSSVTEPIATPSSIVDDFWLLPDDSVRPPPPAEFKSWASFEHVDVPIQAPIFATEQGPRFVDAIVAEHSDFIRPASSSETNAGEDEQDPAMLDTREYCACLLALALGRSSILFSWDDGKRAFLPMVNSARISGFSAQVLRSAERDCLECGNDSRYLRAFVDHTYTAAASTNSPSRVALARGVDSLLLTIQSELGTRGQRAHSLLQLQALVRPVASLVKFIRGLVTKLSRATTSSRTTDEHFLTMLYQETQSMEYSVVFMRDIIKQLLQLVSEPWLLFVSEWIGLSPRSKATLWTGEFQSKGFVRLDDRVWIDDMGAELAESDYFFDEERMPAFIPAEMAKNIFETAIAAQSRHINRECMRLLFGVHGVRKHIELQREFQLLGNGMFCSRLSHALFDPDQAGAERSTGIELSSGGLGLRLSSRNGENWPPASSELRLALMGVLAESYYQGRKSESNEIPASAGAGGKHELPGGMSFAVRDLSVEEMDRCMDPDSLEALDFLRLSYKPPSALLSIITPDILAKYDRVFLLLLRVLRMYYLVNQLFEDDLQSRVRNRAPRPGPSRNKSYFGHEENVCMRFRIESRQFVANIMAYFLTTGVDTPWKRFEAWLDDVQQGLAEPEQEQGTTTATNSAQADQASPDKLRERHEQALDEIMLALLLRKRQQPLLFLLQGIFGLILEFAKGSRELSRAEGTGIGGHKSSEDAALGALLTAHQVKAKKLYASFRKKVAAFLAVCRGLSEKEAESVARKDYQQQQEYQDGSRAGEGSSLSKLLLMLDYNGSYSSSRTQW